MFFLKGKLRSKAKGRSAFATIFPGSRPVPVNGSVTGVFSWTDGFPRNFRVPAGRWNTEDSVNW
jgi:hypothetical protein